MSIKFHHLRYAFMRTAALAVGLIVLLVLIAVVENRTAEDLLWGFGVAFILWGGFFLFWLRRTQNERPK